MSRRSAHAWLLRSRLFKSSANRRRVDKRSKRKLIAELLEDRRLLAADSQGDDIWSAQTITLSANTPLAVSATIGDGNYGADDVDLFAIVLHAGETFTANIDAAVNGSNLDSFLQLFNDWGYQVALNDNDPASPPDSLLTFSVTETGTYYLGVSSLGNVYDPQYEGYASGGSSTGPYTITFLADDGNGAPNNVAPVSNTDYYRLGLANGSITVPSAGVLANDVDSDMNSLTAVLDTPPTYGTLVTFNADGSFVYSTSATEPGSDSFSYYADDGIDDGNVAIVHITFHAAPDVSNDQYASDKGVRYRIGVIGSVATIARC